MKRLLLLRLGLVLWTNVSFGHVFTNREINPTNDAQRDSLTLEDYPFVLPLLGKRAVAAGYALPYSAGISVNYFAQASDIILEDLSVGFNVGEMYDTSSIVKFDIAKSRATALTFRPDVWLLPFLNVYGILGMAQSSTEVKYTINVPDPINDFTPILSGESLVEFQTTTFGFGVMPTIGIGGNFLALDMNIAWVDIPQLEKPIRTFVFGPRVGRNFQLKKPEPAIAVWVGGFRVSLNANTDGSLPLDEAVDFEDFSKRIGQGFDRVETARVRVDDWWASLSPVERLNPTNIAKRTAANRALSVAGEVLVAADNALSNAENSTVQYTMNRRVADPWNFLTGGNFRSINNGCPELKPDTYPQGLSL